MPTNRHLTSSRRPEVLRRPHWQGKLVLLGASVLFVIAGSVISSYGLPFSDRWLNNALRGILVLALFATAMTLPFVCVGRLKRRVIRAGGAICLRCGYRLPSLDDHGTCPECGEDYALGDTRAAWERAFPLAQSKLRRNHAARVLDASDDLKENER